MARKLPLIPPSQFRRSQSPDRAAYAAPDSRPDPPGYGRGVGARAFVGFDPALADAHRIAGRVRQVAMHGHRADLGAKLAGGDRGQRAAVRFECKRILVGARDLPAFGDLLGGQAHAVGDRNVLVALEHRRIHRQRVAGDLRHRADRAARRLGRGQPAVAGRARGRPRADVAGRTAAGRRSTRFVRRGRRTRAARRSRPRGARRPSTRASGCPASACRSAASRTAPACRRRR